MGVLVNVGVIEGVGVCVLVNDGVGVNVPETVFDGVLVGVIVNVGVIEGVGVGVESIQFKQKGFKKLYFGLSILALC